MRAKCKTFPGAQGPCYVDVKKYFSKRRPGRQVNSLRDAVADQLAADGVESKDVTLDQRNRSCSVKGAKAAYVAGGQVVWTAAGLALLNGESRRLVDLMVTSTM